MEAQVSDPEVQKVIETALIVVPEAQGLTIMTTDDYRAGQEYMKKVKDGISTLTEKRMKLTRPLDESKAGIIALFKPPIEKLEAAKTYLNRIMVSYTEDQERKRQEEERRLQEEARKKAEEEALQTALEAEAAGETQEAEQIIQEPVYVPPVRVESQVPKSKESHIRETWSCEVVDLKALVKAIADGKAPIGAVQADMTFLNGLARSYKQALNYPGIHAVSKKTQI